jgi:hypothetical protein
MNPILRNIIFNYKAPEPLSPFAPSYRSAVALWYQISLNGDAVKPMNQRAKGGNFPSTTSFDTNFPAQVNITRSTANNQLTITADATDGQHHVTQGRAIHGVTPVVGRTYTCRGFVHNVAVGIFRIEVWQQKANGDWFSNVSNVIAAGNSGWATVRFTIAETNGSTINLMLKLLNSGGAASFQGGTSGTFESVTISDLTFWDCTADFGASNCPTEAQFTQILANNASIGYHEGVANYVLNKAEAQSGTVVLNQLLTNGNFATGDAELATNWTKIAPSDGTWERTAEGQKVTKIGGGNPGIARVDTPCSAGQTIALNVVAKGTAGATMRLNIVFRDGSNNSVGTSDKDVSLSSNFSSYAHHFIAPVNTATVRFIITIRTASGHYIANQAKAYNLSLPQTQGGFGIGNEPTEAQFTQLLGYNGNPYHEGARAYKFDTMRKNFLKDISGNLRHLRLNNYANTFASGVNLFFKTSDAVDDNDTFYQSALLAANTDCTLVSVFRLPTVPAVDSNIEHWITTGFNTLAVGGASIAVHMYENQLYGLVYNSVANTVEFTTATTAVANTWYRAHVVYTQSDRRARLYINGVSIGQSLALANGIKQTNGIVSCFNAQDNRYLGMDDAVQGIIAKALTASEVVDNCNRIAKLVPELDFAQI